jgi:hypothetical protein
MSWSMSCQGDELSGGDELSVNELSVNELSVDELSLQPFFNIL